MNNFYYSLRYLFKAKGNNITRIISLTLGLSVGIMIFSYLNFQLTFNRDFPDKERIYQMFTHYNAGGLSGMSSQLTAPIASSMMEEIPNIESATRFEYYTTNYIYNSNLFSLSGIAADTCFFEILRHGLISGNPKEILLNPNQALLSQSTAKKLFGDRDPIGKTLTFEKNKDEILISGIYEDYPINSNLYKTEIIIPLIKLKPGKYFDGSDRYETYIKLSKGAKIEDIERALPVLWERHNYTKEIAQYKQTFYFRLLKDSYTEGNIVKLIAMILSGMALLTLLVSCMNYVLISISTMITRSKTIGMLKCTGARKGDVFSLFLWETFIIVITSVALAVLLIISLKSPLEEMLGYKITDIFALNRIWSALMVILGVFILGGLLPAKLFSSIPVSAAFKGISDTQRLWKKVLLFLQITCVTFVVVLLIVISLQYDKLFSSDKGYNYDNLVHTKLTLNKPEFNTLLQEINNIPGVQSSAIGRSLPIYGYSGTPYNNLESGELIFSCRFDNIDCNYLPLMGIDITQGENFKEETPEDNIIINEDFVRRAKWSDSPIGKVVRFSDNKPATIIGVTKDIKIKSDEAFVDPMVFYCKNKWMNNDTSKITTRVLIKLKEMNQSNLDALSKVMDKFSPLKEVNILSYEESLIQSLKYEKGYRSTVLLITLFIIIIVLIGLTGYISDEVRRKNKEIAIRKVNGARFKDIVQLLFGKFAWVLFPAVIVGIAIGYAGGAAWISLYATRISLYWWIFVTGALIVISLVYLVITLLIKRTTDANISKYITQNQ